MCLDFKSVGLLICLILVGFSNVASASDFDVVRPDNCYQDCVSLTVKYCNENPEFIPCSVSGHRYFRGLSHMVAAKIVDNETILLHDPLLGYDSYGNNWMIDQTTFYHFWIDEPVKRNYKFLMDNREMVLY